MPWLHPGRCSARPRDALGDDVLSQKAEATTDWLLASRNFDKDRGKRMDFWGHELTSGMTSMVRV
jgi:hypothetical protein